MKALAIGFTTLLAFATFSNAFAEERAAAPLEESPGYVDFGELAAEYGEPRVMIDVGSSLLRLIGAMDHEDPVAAATLRNMESVRVHVYDTHGKPDPAAERMETMSSKLTSDAWERVVRVREDGERVDIFVKHDSDRIHGVTVMAVDEEEAVFINVLGDIDPSELSSVMERVDIDVDVDVDL